MNDARLLQEGNLISSPFGYKTVKALSADGVIYVDQGEDLSADEVDPVTLTPEILMTAGFKRKPGTDSAPLFTRNGLTIKYTGERFVSTDTEEREIRFVHELQNLYLSTTAEKLRIDMTDPGKKTST